jgi:hypothetical protein
MARIALILAVIAVWVSAASADGIRYVVGSPQKPNADYPIWRSRYDADMCGLAVLRDRDVKKYCEDGLGPGMPAKIGLSSVGTEVEIIDGRACGDLVQIRLEGPLRGGVGCITGQALSARRPDGAPGSSTPGPGRPAPDWCKAENVVWLGDRCVERK